MMSATPIADFFVEYPSHDFTMYILVTQNLPPGL